jgi:N-carbamoyl-L-amino-acid hydrolase
VHEGAAVGVATAIWPHGRWHLHFEGAADHAGTTRLGDRQDPVLPLAATALAARELADRAGAVATVGRVQVLPGAVNAVAASADAWLDCRAPTGDVVQEVVAGVVRAAEQAGREHGVTVQVAQESATPLVTFDGDLRARLSRVLGGVPELPTAAGHDAGVLSAHVPSAMLFVRNRTGVSHSPAEHADTADCVAGVHALADVLADLAGT